MEDERAYQKRVKALMYNGRCESCLKTEQKMFKCSRCLITRYCSTQCQKNHWSTHKLKCKVIDADNPLMKLSKITPYTILSCVVVYYHNNKLDLGQSRALQIDIPNDDFFDLLSGKIKSLTPNSNLLMTSKVCSEARDSKKYVFVRLSYKGKARTAYFPIENIKYLVENGIPMDPSKFEEVISHALEGFQLD